MRGRRQLPEKNKTTGHSCRLPHPSRPRHPLWSACAAGGREGRQGHAATLRTEQHRHPPPTPTTTVTLGQLERPGSRSLGVSAQKRTRQLGVGDAPPERAALVAGATSRHAVSPALPRSVGNATPPDLSLPSLPAAWRGSAGPLSSESAMTMIVSGQSTTSPGPLVLGATRPPPTMKALPTSRFRS